MNDDPCEGLAMLLQDPSAVRMELTKGISLQSTCSRVSSHSLIWYICANSFEVSRLPGAWNSSSAKTSAVCSLLLTKAFVVRFCSNKVRSALRTASSMKRRAFPIRSLLADARRKNLDSSLWALFTFCSILALCCCFSNSAMPSFASFTACRVAFHLSAEERAKE